jgi:hypothetical protein
MSTSTQSRLIKKLLEGEVGEIGSSPFVAVRCTYSFHKIDFHTRSNYSTMTVESLLTRELEIRFIDARAIVTEAKLKLGIDGYHREDQEELLVGEAMAIFNSRPLEVQGAMRKLFKGDLDAVRIPSGSISRSVSDTTTASEEDTASTEDQQATRKFRLWRRR